MDLLEGALPAAPLVLGAAALGRTGYQAGQELDITGVLRMWLQIIARNGEGNVQLGRASLRAFLAKWFV